MLPATVGLGNLPDQFIEVYSILKSTLSHLLLSRIILFSGVRSECYCDSVPQFHQLQYSMRLQQSLPLPSPSLAVFPVAQ